MTIKIRRALFLIFMTAFIVIAPLISLYAAGYKIKLSWPIDIKQILQKTGMFVFDTEPEGAKIYINDKQRQQFFKKYFSNKDENFIKTPAKIKNILPGEYNIKLELEEFWPWQKKLSIYPGQTTIVEDVCLFKKNLPMRIGQLPAQNFFISPDKKFILLKNDKKIIDIDNENEIIELPNIIDEIQTVKWSPDSKKVLINTTIFHINNIDDYISLDKFIGKNIKNIKWSENSNEIFYQYNNLINSFNINSDNNETIFNDNTYYEYLIKNNYIFLIANSNKSTELKIFSTKTKELIRKIDLPFNLEYKFINSDHRALNLIDTKHNILYLIEPLAKINPIKDIINNLKYAQWIDDERLLYANDFEIWLYNFNNYKKILLTRISQPINKILWHPSNNYIIYSTSQSINIIELDEREKRNITKIISLDEISSLFLNKKGDILYFTAKIGNQTGLYKLAIQ